MATESSEGEDEGKIVGGSKHLVVDDDMREMTKNAAWSVSSCKPGNGVQCLGDDNGDTYWQETFVNTFMLQIAVLSNHLNGRDTHVRQIKVYGPRPNPIPRQPFQFTSAEFVTYSTVR